MSEIRQAVQKPSQALEGRVDNVAELLKELKFPKDPRKEPAQERKEESFAEGIADDVVRARQSHVVKNEQYPDRTVTVSASTDPRLYELMKRAKEAGYEIKHDHSAKSADIYKLVDPKGKTVEQITVGLLDNAKDQFAKMLEGRFGGYAVVFKDGITAQQLERLGVDLNLGRGRVSGAIDLDNYMEPGNAAKLRLTDSTAHIEIGYARGADNRNTNDIEIRIIDKTKDGAHDVAVATISSQGIVSLGEPVRMQGPAPTLSKPIEIANAFDAEQPLMIYRSQDNQLYGLLERAQEAGYQVEFRDGGKAIAYLVRDRGGSVVGSFTINGLEGNSPNQWSGQLKDLLGGLLKK